MEMIIGVIATAALAGATLMAVLPGAIGYLLEPDPEDEYQGKDEQAAEEWDARKEG